MKSHNKGFAITSIIYSMLILFLTLVVLIIGNLASRKTVFDKQKNDILEKFAPVVEKTKYEDGEVVYFNVTIGEKCDNYTAAQSDVGVKSGCMKFYAFNDSSSSETVDLILDHNTTANIDWNSSKFNINGPKELLEALKNDTANWLGTETPKSYTINQGSDKANYTINYGDEYNARIIEAREIAQIVGFDDWNEETSTSSYYFDSKTSTQSTTCKSGNTTGCNFGWLYDRTSESCSNFGCLNNSNSRTSGYWTISPNPYPSEVVGEPGDEIPTEYRDAWYVTPTGSIDFDEVKGQVVVDLDTFESYPGGSGVRPVITVKKSLLN